MADFCKQCSEKMFGKDFEDLKLGGPDDAPTDVWAVLCEGCVTPHVTVLVNRDGECVDPKCEVHA